MHRVFRKLFRFLIDGMLVVLPFVITFALLLYPLNFISEWLSSFSRNIFSWFLSDEERASSESPFLVFLSRYCSPGVIKVLAIIVHVPYSGLFFVLFLLICFGMIVSNVFIQSGVRLLEHILLKIPGVTLLYSYVKESTAAFVGKFNKPVLVTINKELGIQKVGFITQEDVRSFHELDGRVAVYLPHSYAFSGELMFFPRKDVHLLEITPTMAWKLTLSGGLASVKSPLIKEQASDVAENTLLSKNTEEQESKEPHKEE